MRFKNLKPYIADSVRREDGQVDVLYYLSKRIEFRDDKMKRTEPTYFLALDREGELFVSNQLAEIVHDRPVKTFTDPRTKATAWI